MGATQSNERGPPWVGDAKTYTLPRTGGRRSVSVSGAAHVVYRTSTGHPDAPDPGCRLLRVNPRLSRSHSLDEVCPLSPWAIHHLALIDAAHAAKTPTSTHTSSNKASEPTAMKVTMLEAPPSAPVSRAVRSGIARKTGRPEMFNEQWRPPTNGWQEPPASPTGPPPPSPAIPIFTSGVSAFTPEDLRKGVCESWAWADQDDACSLTDRPCDSVECAHCRAKVGNKLPAPPRLEVEPYHPDDSLSDDPTQENEERHRQERRSEPALAGTTAPEPVDSRRHTLPVPRTGGVSRLTVPPPVFCASSWETLPPADELEVELEEKTITEALSLPPVPSAPPAPNSPTSSHSLNSSLSSLSHISVHRDHSECDSWPSSPAADPVRCTELPFLPGFTPSPVPPVLPSPLASPNCAAARASRPAAVPEPPPPITGTLHVEPPSPQGTAGDIVFSVTIPPTPPSPKDTAHMGVSNNSSGAGHARDAPDDVPDAPRTLVAEHPAVNGLDGTPAPVEESRKPTPRRPAAPTRQRSFSLDESRAASRPRPRTQNTQIQTIPAEPIDDFLRAVESRIPRNSLPISPPPPIPLVSPPSTPASTPSTQDGPSPPTVVLDAFTQTSPAPSPPSASRASSDAFLSECGCDDHTSLEPCPSSLALTVSEDDYDEDDDEDDDDDWSADESVSSSSPPHTPASLPHDDSSLSLSESLDTLGLNGESGIGTVSTRPSDSPRPIPALDLSGSNLSSEDTGLENSFERQIRRYIPAPSSGARTSGEVYRRRRPRPRAPEQWVRRENQTTQTDPEPPATARSPQDDVREYGEHLARGRGREVRVVRHTHSEPRLDTSLTPLAGLLRDVCSEAALPPLPSHSPRPSLTPSVPILPTLTEDKPPIAPNTRICRPRHLSLSSSPHHHHSTARSAPTLETRWLPPAALTPATTPSEDSSGEAPMLSTRAQSSKELAELEALEACKWLRAAGFPQYAQMYEELQFPLDLVSVERDHSFLERDSLQALFRRLTALNRCARIRLDSARKSKAEESDDDEDLVAISDNWLFQRQSRRWSRLDQERSPRSGGGGESQGLEVPDEALLSQFKRSGSERLKDGAKAFLRRMESLKNKKKKRHRDGVVIISSPKLVDEAGMRERVGHLGCVDLPTEASPMLTSHSTTTTSPTSTPAAAASTTITTIPATATTTITTTTTTRELMGEDSSDHSQGSTPLSRARRRRRLPRRGAGGTEAGGGSGAHSDSEYSPQTWRHHYLTDANSNTMASPAPASSSPKHQRGSRGSGSRSGQVRHTGSLNYGKESQSAREHFLASIRGGVDKASGEDQASPPPSPSEDRHSVYDNVPLIICNKVYHDYQPEGLDSETSVPEGSGSSESRDSPLPSTHDDEDNDDSTSRGRATVERWHSFNRRSYQPVARQLGTQINGFSSGQMLHLRKRALLRLTALMERYCPSNRSGWNWELPKFMRKTKTPDYKERQVFGVPLQVVAQRTGQPLPPGIQAALQYLRATSLDQVGIFRKPGVRSRIQKLRELHEEREDVIYSSFSTCDIADMVKTYFRELPEVLLTNKLSEMFIAIFQYLPNEHRLEALQCAVLMLPDENREVLMALLTFLADVAANAPLNQMTASNLAVCLAPSLFHLNVGGSSGSSPLRRRPGSTPEQKDLHENMAAHQCLSLMILQVSQLQCVPVEMLSNCRFTYLEQSQPVCLEDLGMGSPGGPRNEGDWNSYMNACITSLFKEARDKSRGWVSMNCNDSEVEVLYRKVGDGHPLRLWRATTEVEAPPAELLNRVIRERHLWDDSLFKWRVVSRLDRQSEVFQYMCNSMPPRPPVDYCVLRHWRSDLARGSCVVVETSVEHVDAPMLVGGVRGIVLASRYLIQPCGSGKSRITHISRVDMRGRTPEWYNKIYGHVTATHLKHIRQSFQHHASGPESKV
ncbi:hypothetical protein O3P69_001488 [Scylla paramamosain]